MFRSFISSIAKELATVAGPILQNCYVVAPRSLAHRTTSLLVQVVNELALEPTVLQSFCHQFLVAATELFHAIKRFKHAGSLHYFTVFIYSVVKVRCAQL